MKKKSIKNHPVKRKPKKIPPVNNEMKSCGESLLKRVLDENNGEFSLVSCIKTESMEKLRLRLRLLARIASDEDAISHDSRKYMEWGRRFRLIAESLGLSLGRDGLLEAANRESPEVDKIEQEMEVESVQKLFYV